MRVIMNENVILRLKNILAELRKINKWLAEKLNKDGLMVSRWCTNEVQPSRIFLRDCQPVWY